MDRRRQPTPRAAVLPQKVRSLIPVPREGQPQPLKGAIYLSTSEGDHTLYSERVLIGRGPHCRIIVLDPLVSREHALIRISKSEVVLEDLRSANGVYVNNVRIFEPQQLFEGDRILVGTNELAVFASGSTEHARPMPLASSQPAQGQNQVPLPAVPTERADALDVLGRLADRMLSQGMPEDAERVLADHLKRVLQGARSGIPLPPALCANTSRYALLLAAQLHSGAWINYALELHLRAKLPILEETLVLLRDAVRSAKNVDQALFGFYVEWLREEITQLPPETVSTLEALEKLKLG